MAIQVINMKVSKHLAHTRLLLTIMENKISRHNQARYSAKMASAKSSSVQMEIAILQISLFKIL